MVRKLKYHEQKLLKKVDFISWELDNNIREATLMRRYCIKKREDLQKYKKLAMQVRQLCLKIKDLDPSDSFRTEYSALVLEKLFMIGLIRSKVSLEACGRIDASSFCRRRLPVLMKKCKMAQTVSMASKFVEHGHVRVGAEVVKDPAFLVNRNLEDFITWVDGSAIRKHVQEYNEMRDDFETT